MKAILVDIDHTLSDAFHRDPMIGGDGGWDAYHAASVNDQPIHAMMEFVQFLSYGGYPIIGLTARPEKWRKLTYDWLVKHAIPLDELLMRPDNAFRPAPEIKVELVKARFGDALASEVLMVIDDREDVCAAFRALGLIALQVHAMGGSK